MPTMIFHAPFPLNRQAKAASGIRPVRLYDSFRAEGYDVYEVTGNASERRRKIKKLRTLMSSGALTVDFLYSESATIPTMLTEPRHLPPHPFVDPALFKLCRQHGVPTGLFYRDVYWVFDSYTRQVGAAVAAAMRVLYRFDLSWYSRYVDRLYVPSLKMGEETPIYPVQRMKALPPGCVAEDIPRTHSRGGLNLLYIGGMGDHYRLHELFKAVSQLERVSLTICTHQGQWEAVKAQYQEYLTGNIHIVHESGEGLKPLYAQADIACLYVEPDEYRVFASPVKLYEYIGYGKPVITSSGTLSATFVDEHECGWVLPYDAEALKELLTTLLHEPDILEARIASTRVAREQHTWQARAREVARDLGTLAAHQAEASRA